MLICNGAEYLLDEHNRRIVNEDRQCWRGEPTPVTPDSTHLNKKVLAPVFLTVFVGMIWITAVRPFIADIASAMNLSIPVIGQLMTVAMFTIAVAGLFAGPLADHYGHRRSIIIGLGLLSISSLVIGLSPNFPTMLFGAVIGGFGAAMTYGVAFAVVTHRYVDDARRKGLGFTQAAGTSATIISAPLLTAIAAIFLWRGAYVFVAIIIALTAVVVARALPADPPPPERRISASLILNAYRPLLASQTMLALYGGVLIRAMIYLGLAIYLSALYVERFNFSVQQIGIAMMIEAIGLVAGNLVVGSWLGRFDQRSLFAISALVLGTGWFVVYTVGLSAVGTIAVAAVVGFFSGISFTALSTLLAQNTTTGAATTMVLNISVIGLGSSIGAALGGVVVKFAGFEGLGISVLPLALVAILLVWHPAHLRPHLPQRVAHSVRE